MTVARTVRALRQARGWSLEKLAAEAELTASTVWRVESGKVEPQVETLRRLAAALEVPVGALLIPEEAA